MIGSSFIPILMSIIAIAFMFIMSARNRIHLLAFTSLVYLIFLTKYYVVFFLLLLLLNYLCKKYIFNSRWLIFFLVGVNISAWLLLKLDPSHLVFPANIVLPVGFSIFIFQQITFIVADKRQINNDFFFSDYLLYSVFLGNIATGPILDFNEFRHQIKSKLYLNSANIHLGALIFLVGFFKKIVFADSFSQVTYFLFESTTPFSGNLLIPFLLNKYEIYLNFLAFSEMAIGIGLIFSIQLRPNFNRPFATTSIAEFWKRWHMTLIEWIRIYVFYPLVVSPVGRLGTWLLVLVTFVVFGLWHGFTWNHLSYGVIQFVLVFLDVKLGARILISDNRYLSKGYRFVKWIWFYVVLISLPALIFRSADFTNVKRVLNNIFTTNLWSTFKVFEYTPITLMVFFLYVVLNELIETNLNLSLVAKFLQKSHLGLKLLLFLVYLLVVFYFGIWLDTGNFIYSRY